MPEQQPPRTELPESLRAQLVDFRRQLWRAKIAEAVIAGLFGFLVSFLVVLGLDRFWPTPGLLRAFIFLAGTLLAAAFAPYWLHRWVWRHRHGNQLARLIARKHPGLGDRLLGVIELERQNETGDTMSPRLRAAAMEAVAAEAALRKLDNSLPASRHRRWGLALLALFVLTGLVFLSIPEASVNAFKRWLMPLSDTERYTFTTLEKVPDHLIVPVGEEFSVDATLSPQSHWKPATGSARFNRQDPLRADLHKGSYHFEFPGQQERGRVRLEVGDAFHDILVTPTLRPVLTATTATIHFPEYLQREPLTMALDAGMVQAVEGSTVSFAVTADRALATASFGPLVPIDPDTEVPDTEALDMSIQGVKASSPVIPVHGGPFRIPLAWKDTLGLEGMPGFELRLDSTPDQAPSVYFEGTLTQKAMLPEETIEVTILGNDDFGLKDAGLVWEGAELPADAPVELHLLDGAPDLSQCSIQAAFSPATLNLKPQKIVLRAFAEDYFPGRGRVYSQPITLYVMTREEHAEMIKNMFDRALGELEDLARREQNLYEENQRLERMEGEELRQEENQKRLENQQNQEHRQAENMKELSEQMEELTKNAVRNENIDPEVIRRMSKTMESMRQLGEKQLPGVENKLQEAGDARNSDDKTEQDMQEAVDQQRQALEKIQQTINEANEAREQFEAGTFVARLKRAASEQDAVTQSTVAELDNSGLFPEQLDPAVLTRLDEIGRKQSSNTSDVRWIQEDLGHFFTRSDNPAFGEVFNEMNESGIALSLDEVRRQVSDNHGWEASEDSERWAGKLKEWAKKLDDATGQQGGGGGGGGGAGEDEDFEFMLRVMRLVQQEQSLRSRTRALETLRRSYTNPEQP